MQVFRLLRYTKKKISRLVRKWFVYITIMGVMGNSGRIIEHVSVWKPWRLAKQVIGYVMVH